MTMIGAFQRFVGLKALVPTEKLTILHLQATFEHIWYKAIWRLYRKS